MVHGKPFIVSSPGIVIDTDGLHLTYSKLKLHPKNDAADPRLRIELVGRPPAREGHRAAVATSVRGGVTVRQLPHGSSRHALNPYATTAPPR
jgi:hypothetical protein